jgi:HNH endonuclease
MRPLKPIYVLAHGIEVIGEYAPTGTVKYWVLRIRPHWLFPNVSIFSGGMYVLRSRAILSAHLGRPLRSDEHVHHIDGNKTRDVLSNLEVMPGREHVSHHKKGGTRRVGSNQLTSQSLKRAYANGTHSRPVIKNRDSRGRITS